MPQIQGIRSFGTTGIFSSLKGQFPINYSAEVGTVYRDLTVALIRRDDLDILFYVSSPRRGSSIILSSWVPDWTAEQYGRPFPMFSRHFKSAGDRTKSFSTSENILKVIGVLVDKVTTMAPLLRDRDTLDGSNIYSHLSYLIQWLASAKSMTVRADPYPSGENIETAFWKTLLCNTGSDGHVIAHEYCTHFEAYMRHVYALSHPTDSDLEEPPANTHVDEDSATKFMDPFKEVSADRLFCIIRNGFMGWVPSDTHPEDLICIF